MLMVLEMVSVLPQGPYDLFCDLFLTSLPLLDKLTQLGHFGTSTIRVNRLKNCRSDLKASKKKRWNDHGYHR